MRKINSIDNKGRILFVDDKGTGTTLGTRADCEAYGYQFENGQCRVPKDKLINKLDNNHITGINNTVSGINNSVLGHSNKLFGSNAVSIGTNNVTQLDGFSSVALGTNVYAEQYGEFAINNNVESNKTKFSIVQFSGTTNNTVATELFIGGNTKQRYVINESYESAIFIETRSVCLDTTNNDAAFRSNLLLYKYANNTLTEVLDTGYVNTGDSGLNAVATTFTPVSDTPDYIKVEATGISSTRLDWNIVLFITEVRNG